MGSGKLFSDCFCFLGEVKPEKSSVSECRGRGFEVKNRKPSRTMGKLVDPGSILFFLHVWKF